MKPLPLSFFNRPTLEVAKDLIGCYLVRKRGNKVERLMITETEAYDGFLDKASHAHRGKTKRNEIMFREYGHIYVYFTYGIHWMLNLVTGPAEYPSAVLIRGVEGLPGPARLTKVLVITGALNGKLLSKKAGLWIERPAKKVIKLQIKKTARIGIDSSGPIWSKKKWRFVTFI